MAGELGFRRPSVGVNPPYNYPAYASTVARSPKQPLVILPHTLSEATGPIYGHNGVDPTEADMTRQHKGEPIGERIIVSGRVLDEHGRPVANSLIELWQANAAGRYVHKRDDHGAPLDPNFAGAGRCVSDEKGRYRFVTVKPGAYPWRNHHNAWRPAHIHFSLFGASFITRLVTQMYFPADPLCAFDPIYNSVPDEKARGRMVAQLDMELTMPEWALGYRFDIVLRGPDATPMES